jgi:hypothetical protein
MLPSSSFITVVGAEWSSEMLVSCHIAMKTTDLGYIFLLLLNKN